MKSISAIHLAITENLKDLIVKCTHISMHGSHSISISALQTHYIILQAKNNVKSASAIKAVFKSLI